MQLEPDLQSAGVLAGLGGVLVGLGVSDDEEANTGYDQVPVCPVLFGSARGLAETHKFGRYVPWDFGKTKYSAK